MLLVASLGGGQRHLAGRLDAQREVGPCEAYTAQCDALVDEKIAVERNRRTRYAENAQAAGI